MRLSAVPSGQYAPQGVISAFGDHRWLTLELAKRDILGRYRGASFGLVWSLLSPCLMLAIYTLAFGYVLKSRWPGAEGNNADFAIILFLGLITHGFFSECLTRAPALITGNVNLVKKIVFPLHVLPWTVVLSAFFHFCANVIVLILLNLALRGEFSFGIFLLPVVLLPLAFVALGLIWLVSSLSVYLRDIAQITGVVSTALLFLSSAIVPVHTLPAKYQWIFNLNPLTFIIDQAREVAFWSRMPDWQGLVLYLLIALAFSYASYCLFQKLRVGFADVL